MPQIIKLEEIPKLQIDSAVGGYNKECFTLAFGSGLECAGFAFTPSQFKAIVNMMIRNLRDHEGKYGVIDMSHVVHPSPISIQDLNMSGRTEEDKGLL